MIKKLIKNNVEIINVIFAIIVFSICFCFLLYKASHAAFTHDESYSFLHYTSLSIIDIISYKDPFPNNHILNTLAMKLFSMICGTSEFSLRIPELISFVIFSIYTFRILNPIDKFIFIPAYLLIFSNPFLLDFFFLVRGYGMAISFMTVSIFYFIQFHSLHRPIDLWISLLFASLSAISNFGLIHFLICLIITHNIIWLYKKVNSNTTTSIPDFLKYHKPIMVCLIVCLTILYEPIRKIIKFKLIDFGGNAGFYTDTIGSLLSYSTCGKNTFDHTFLKYIIIATVIINAIICVMLIKNKLFKFPLNI